MISSYAIDLRRKFTEQDLTVELYGCDLKCRYCCSAHGRRKPPRYHGVQQILDKMLELCERHRPHAVRFTGGEFSIHGDEAIELFRQFSEAVDVGTVIETNLTSRQFYERFARELTPWHTRNLMFIVSVKAEDHVIEGPYSTEQIVANVRRLYELFPRTYIAHGFIGFGDGFRKALFTYFPELGGIENQIRLEREGRFTFESLTVNTEDRALYYFDQRIKRYRVSQHTEAGMTESESPDRSGRSNQGGPRLRR